MRFGRLGRRLGRRRLGCRRHRARLLLVHAGGSATDDVLGIDVEEVGRIAPHLPPTADRRGDVTAALYGYLVVHVVDAGAVGRRRRRPLVRGGPRVIGRGLGCALRVGRRDHLHGVGNLESAHERHGPPPIFAGYGVTNRSRGRRRGGRRNHAGLPLDLGRLVRRKDGHAATDYRVVGGA